MGTVSLASCLRAHAFDTRTHGFSSVSQWALPSNLFLHHLQIMHPQPVRSAPSESAPCSTRTPAAARGYASRQPWRQTALRFALEDKHHRSPGEHLGSSSSSDRHSSPAPLLSAKGTGQPLFSRDTLFLHLTPLLPCSSGATDSSPELRFSGGQQQPVEPLACVTQSFGLRLGSCLRAAKSSSWHGSQSIFLQTALMELRPQAC